MDKCVAGCVSYEDGTTRHHKDCSSSPIQECKWLRAFDGHFNISCANETNQRGNGQFKPSKEYPTTTWDFTYCPYCGRKIIVEEE